MKKSKHDAMVVADWQRHTCIVFIRTKTEVTFIALSLEELRVQVLSCRRFDEIYTHDIPIYAPERAARHYLNHAQLFGASDEALSLLGTLTTVTEEDRKMAKKATAKKAMTETTKAALREAKARSKAKEPKEPRGPSAASVFMGLIMEGKFTDDEIFAKVQAQFNLDQKKRSYVAWYRNHLRKLGKNPPAAIGSGAESKPTKPTESTKPTKSAKSTKSTKSTKPTKTE